MSGKRYWKSDVPHGNNLRNKETRTVENTIGIGIVLSVCAISVTFLAIVAGFQMFESKKIVEENKQLAEKNVRRSTYDHLVMEYMLHHVNMEFSKSQMLQCFQDIMKVNQEIRLGDKHKYFFKKATLDIDKDARTRMLKDQFENAIQRYCVKFRAYKYEYNRSSSLLKKMMETHPDEYAKDYTDNVKNDINNLFLHINAIDVQYELDSYSNIDTFGGRSLSRTLLGDEQLDSYLANIKYRKDKFLIGIIAKNIAHYSQIKNYIELTNWLFRDDIEKFGDLSHFTFDTQFVENCINIMSYNSDRYYDVVTYYNIAFSLSKSGHVRDAIKYYTMASDLLYIQTDYSDKKKISEALYINLLELLMVQGKYSKVADCFDDFSKREYIRDTEYANVCYLLGVVSVLLMEGNESDKAKVVAREWVAQGLSDTGFEFDFSARYGFSQLSNILKSSIARIPSGNKYKKRIEDIRDVERLIVRLKG